MQAIAIRTEKRCSRCSETKPIDDFYPDSTKHRAAYCRPCSRAYARERAKLPRVKAVRAAWAKGKGKEAVRKYKERWPAKRHAREMVRVETEAGRMRNPHVCSACTGTERVEAHHDDYAKPLAVRWLCRWCHRAWHRENGEGRNAAAPAPARTRRIEQKERRRLRHSLIPSMLAGGLNQKQIAAELGVTQPTIWADLRYLNLSLR